MTDHDATRTGRKKTPDDVSEFEREQLRFFLSQGDVGARLAEMNPSLAWLPALSQLKVIDNERQLLAWIGRNLSDISAVSDVVANIRFFGADTATFIERKLNDQQVDLSPLLRKSWTLIVRHLRTSDVDANWFEIQPQIKRGDHAAGVLERLANVLRPKLRVSRRLGGIELSPTIPTDLMGIDYEVSDGVSPDSVLAAWPAEAEASVDKALLVKLTASLVHALGDATDAGVEAEGKFSISDTDVPSVASHHQNEFRSGFQIIVRVIAEVWTRLAKKSPLEALNLVLEWSDSTYRLVRRLALFGAADTTVPADFVADILAKIPAGELFLSNSSVEIYRLVRARWVELPPNSQKAILSRFYKGPPREWFREGADIERAIDRCRFDLLANMAREGADIGQEGEELLRQILGRWPDWQPRPIEQAGFHIWRGNGTYEPTSTIEKLRDVADEALVKAAQQISATKEWMDGDVWQELCANDPDRAARGLIVEAELGNWPPGFWERLLWSRTAYSSTTTEQTIARSLLRMPVESLAEIINAVSSWLTEHSKTLPDDALWPVWDRLLVTPTETAIIKDRDLLGDALSAPSGRLAEILIKRMVRSAENDLPVDLSDRFNNLLSVPGENGLLARVRLAADLSFLFDRAPRWTTANMIRLFDWSVPNSVEFWRARKYANYIGSPELFRLLKEPFLQMFERTEPTSDDLSTFAEWLVVMLIANTEGANYPIDGTEVRSALRRAGVNVLPRVGHRLAMEMERAKADEKIERWRRVVGPVFRTAWPLDVELQTRATTFKLVQILRATGDAFPEAAETIIPFIQPESGDTAHTSLFSIAEAKEDLYAKSPKLMLDLIVAVVGDSPSDSIHGLKKALERLRAVDPEIATSRKFQRLMASAY